MISKEILQDLRNRYPMGKRVELIYMDDEKAPVKGILGTVLGIDDIGSIMVNWDNGSSLNVLYGVDKVKILK